MVRRGVTLLEILIVIALIVSISSLALPVMSRALDERSFEASVERVETQLLLARAEAMARGDTLAVEFEPGDKAGQIVVRLFRPGGDRAATGRMEARPPETAPLEMNGADVRAIPTNKPPLPTPVFLERGRSLTGERPELIAGEALDLTRESEREPFRMAVYLPDGSAVVRASFWLVDQSGRMAEVRINPWTGVPEIDRVHVEDEPDGDVDRDPLDFDSSDEPDVDRGGP